MLKLHKDSPKAKTPLAVGLSSLGDSERIFGAFDNKALEELARCTSARQLSEEQMERELPDFMGAAVSSSALSLWRYLNRNRAAILSYRHRAFGGFERRLRARWRKPLDLFESFVELNHEVGSAFTAEHLAQAGKDDFVLFVLSHLHARASQTAGEILTLLRAGYPDGADARWRCLHELNVVMQFISKHGKDVARRFLHYSAIESHRAAEQYQEFAPVLGFRPLGKRAIKRIEKSYAAVVAAWGNASQTDYSWAAEALGKRRPSVHDLAANVGLGHMKPFYNLSCYNVHASPKRIGYSLGYQGLDVLPAGPSDMGLADPAQNAALSLSQITGTLLCLRPSILGITLQLVLQHFAEAVGRSFVSTQKRREKAVRRGQRGRVVAGRKR